MRGLSVSRGNMYDWVTHMWPAMDGCPHQCTYCYVRSRGRDQPAVPTLRPEPWPALGAGRVIFVCHQSDLFASTVPDEWIRRILDWCGRFPNEYVFQTKNPERVWTWHGNLPSTHAVGTTIETNRVGLLAEISSAPRPVARARGLRGLWCRTFLTIEPVMDFDLPELLDLVVSARPDFVNIGADSKGHHLPEPSREKVLRLVADLQAAGIEVRKKTNLGRLMA